MGLRAMEVSKLPGGLRKRQELEESQARTGGRRAEAGVERGRQAVLS